jgi:hypothetical protein
MNTSHAVERSKVQLPILKVRPGCEVECVFLEAGPLWYGVHWVTDRALLCALGSTEGCPLCALNISRVVGVTMVLVQVRDAWRPLLLELSPTAFSTFEARCRFAGLVLGDGVLAVVSRPRARSGLRIEPLQRHGVGEHFLDVERRLVGAWAVLYGLPLPMLTETFDEFQIRVSSIVEARGRIAAEQMTR